MKTTYLFIALFLSFGALQAQNRDSLIFQTSTDSVCFWNTGISATCGTSYEIIITTVNDSITILESDTSNVYFRCICNYDVGATLSGLPEGSYTAYVYRTGMWNRDTVLIGSADFYVPQSSPSQFSYSTYNVDCYNNTGVPAGTAVIPHSFSLMGNYPNPFNAATVIRYQIHKSGRVRLEIFDELGKSAALLVDGEKAQGDYEIIWNASDFSSGLYICKLTLDSENQAHKMTLLK